MNSASLFFSMLYNAVLINVIDASVAKLVPCLQTPLMGKSLLKGIRKASHPFRAIAVFHPVSGACFSSSVMYSAKFIIITRGAFKR